MSKGRRGWQIDPRYLLVAELEKGNGPRLILLMRATAERMHKYTAQAATEVEPQQ